MVMLLCVHRMVVNTVKGTIGIGSATSPITEIYRGLKFEEAVYPFVHLSVSYSPGFSVTLETYEELEGSTVTEFSEEQQQPALRSGEQPPWRIGHLLLPPGDLAAGYLREPEFGLQLPPANSNTAIGQMADVSHEHPSFFSLKPYSYGRTGKPQLDAISSQGLNAVLFIHLFYSYLPLQFAA